MKTFLFSIPLRLKLKSQELDVQAVLCNKAWSIFNDEGKKQLFIFQPDGTLYVTINGDVTNSSWTYVPANKSIIITSGGKSSMFHPAFLDDVIFALQKDGDKTLLFMIDEKNTQMFIPKTYTELVEYFYHKEQELIDKEKKDKEEKDLLDKKRKEEAEKQAKALALGIIKTFSNGLLVCKRNDKLCFNNGKTDVTGPLDEIYVGSLYLNRFISARDAETLHVYYWDENDATLSLCFTWNYLYNMKYCFSKDLWRYGGKQIPDLPGSQGRLVNGNHCLDIIQDNSSYRIVEHEIINPRQDKYPIKNKIFSIILVILYFLLLIGLLVLQVIWIRSLSDAPKFVSYLGGLVLLGTVSIGGFFGIELYGILKNRYYAGLPLRLSFSKEVWNQGKENNWHAPLKY